MKEFGSVPLSEETIAARNALRDNQRSKTMPEVIEEAKAERKARDKRLIERIMSDSKNKKGTE